jgi:Zn finger protein HypA/HybF involved in hydrogenase expression
MTNERRQELLELQTKLCKDKQYPHFAPYRGTCYSCNKDIVNESWAVHLITGCPKCSRSFCD